MDHLDEHTIELYIVGSRRIEAKKGEIERHLAECPSCHDLSVRMEEYYADFGQVLAESDRVGIHRSRAIVRGRPHIKPMYERHAEAVHVESGGKLVRMFAFSRRHPIAVSGGSIALLAGLALLLNLAIPRANIDQDPAYCRYSLSQGLVEIRNSNNRILWDLPTTVKLADSPYVDKIYLSRVIYIGDLNRDGMNEVVSTLQLGDEVYNHTLRIFDSRKETLFEQGLSESFGYLDRTYTPNIDVGSMLVEDVIQEGKKEIWVAGNSRDRSPSVAIRMDRNGNVLGKYWHFGQFREIYCARLGPDQKKRIILAGTDDAEDTTHGEFPAIVVLDPEKVVGESCSLRSPGFAFPPSDAELLYISLPESDINLALGNKPGRTLLIDTSQALFQFRTSTRVDRTEPDYFEFDYLFDLNMDIQEVKSNNFTDDVHESLARKGLVHGVIDRSYLKDLRTRVRYFDGSSWHRELVQVHHPTHVAMQ
jgi:hypothetical protein